MTQVHSGVFSDRALPSNSAQRAITIAYNVLGYWSLVPTDQQLEKEAFKLCLNLIFVAVRNAMTKSKSGKGFIPSYRLPSTIKRNQGRKEA